METYKNYFFLKFILRERRNFFRNLKLPHLSEIEKKTSINSKISENLSESDETDSDEEKIIDAIK